MQLKKLAYIQKDDKYVTLKKKFIKPPINAEFISRALIEFSKSNVLDGSSVTTMANRFGAYVFECQQHLASPVFELDQPKKSVPLVAMMYPTCTTSS